MSSNADLGVDAWTSRASKISSIADAKISSQKLFLVALLLGDAAIILGAFLCAYLLRFEVGIGVATEVVPHPEAYLRLSVLLVPMWLFIFSLMRLYDMEMINRGDVAYASIFNACTWGTMIIILYSFLNPDFVIARGWLVLSWALTSILISLYRSIITVVVIRMRERGHFIARGVIVGMNEEAVALANQLGQTTGSGLKILGCISTDSIPTNAVPTHSSPTHSGPTHSGPTQEATQAAEKLRVLGHVNDLTDIVELYGVEEVIVAATAVNGPQLIDISSQLNGRGSTRMRISSGLYEVFTTGMENFTRNSVPLISLSRLRLSRSQLMAKTLVDYCLIILALPFLLPLFLVLATLVYLDSKGPIFYRRQVLGLGGETFNALKLRTMYVDGAAILARHPELQEQLNAEQKLKNDPRITRVGKFLRRTSLDELPQLINVLMGQMSLVGPRMISPGEHKFYGRMKHNLLTVKPGLTGMWQVSGRSDLTYEERVNLDMYYIRNYSIWLDLQILFVQTIPAVLKGKGAY